MRSLIAADIFAAYRGKMIYTVTFNPSLDYYVKVNNLKSGIVNRTVNEYITVGGKGINV